jgi:hypothetical protein
LSWQWQKVWKFEGTWVTTMPCHMWPPGWVTGPGSQGHWGFSKAKTANRRSLGNQGRCHLQKSVRRYSQSQLSTDNQNAFALLGTNLPHSTLWHAQISQRNLPLHPRHLHPSQSAPSLKRMPVVSLVLNNNNSIPGQRLHPPQKPLVTNRQVQRPRKRRCFLIDMVGRGMITRRIGRNIRLIFKNTVTLYVNPFTYVPSTHTAYSLIVRIYALFIKISCSWISILG